MTVRAEPLEGVDYAWERPVPAALKAAGKAFACRYGGVGSDGKLLHPAEAKALTAAGLSIVANVEGTANGLLQGWSTGASWAKSADTWFRGCGMPADRPIYFSVDFDVNASQWPAVAEALRGAASIIGLERVGIYGSYHACLWAKRDNVARWLWQTYAWSAGTWVTGLHIKQYRNGVNVAGASVDLDQALTVDYGQWGQQQLGDDMSDQAESILASLANGSRTYVGSDGKQHEFVPTTEIYRNIDFRAAVNAALGTLGQQLNQVQDAIAELSQMVKTLPAGGVETLKAGDLITGTLAVSSVSQAGTTATGAADAPTA